MKNKLLLLIMFLACKPEFVSHAALNQLLGWNNLGMHCMDSDYSVFSILPPYNTIESQLIVNGKLVTNGIGYTVTYQAIADPSGSFNSTAMGKGNYYTYAASLFGPSLAPDAGLAGWNMPGVGNIPQPMLFEQTNVPAAGVATPVNWFRAEGIPISPYDDAHRKNAYPMMRLIARSGSTAIATNDIVLPVSDEMDCRACHASGAANAAKPAAGWVWNGIQERDFRLNILRLHDEHQFAQHAELYQAALAARGFNSQGLYRGVVVDGKPVLCAACHASEALGAPSYGTIPPLTASIHSFHAHVIDPVSNTTLDSAVNRSACYQCHPGSTTRCLRGAMGGAVAPDGSMEMQCQSCHGTMSTVGSPNRVGWFMEPNCASCHTGTATSNNGQIRYASIFSDTNGTVRIPVNQTFSTQPNIPATGISLFRFSAGHGGLQCEACHGSTHAEFPSTHVNDNVRNKNLQGHAGVMIECTACHVTMTATATNVSSGPHGMHPIGQSWVTSHHDLIGQTGGSTQCKACHGTDYRGTVLSKTQGDRSFSVFGGTILLARGTTIGCYTCHKGPSQDSRNTNAVPSVVSVSVNTSNNVPIVITLPSSGAGATLRIISQPTNGTVGLSSNLATYFPNAGFVGTDTFTFAAYDGSKNSSIGTGSITVAQGLFSLSVTPHVPPSYPSQWPTPFAVVPLVTNNAKLVTYDWDFGDGSVHANDQFPTHLYASAGSYQWAVTASLSNLTATATGTIEIGVPVTLGITYAGNTATLSWPNTIADTLLETTSTIDAQSGWAWKTNAPVTNGGLSSVTIPVSNNQFFRVRRPW